MDNHYHGVIWTNHALERLRERKIKQGDAWATWNRPEHSRKGSAPGSWVYYRTWGSEQIEVVAKQNDKREWLILSVWSRPAVMFKEKKKESSLFTFLLNFFVPKHNS
jgi:hypothetical protein